MIIGTAGHIDHGKSALVRALTGVDTDRLKEEKARGISIDLGFAYLPVDDGRILGFVDVPGHERFVRNMLAGATGIDAVLLVVAADDGVMPQTVEHLAIVDLLGIRLGLVALTKTDLVPPARLAEVTREIAALLESTALAGVEVMPVSSVTGMGIDALRARIVAMSEEMAARASRGRFRLAVDRSFTLAGVGTVVTGTVMSGEVAVGDSVAVSPSGLSARVRSIHAQNRAAARGRAGERCALNLAGEGISKDAIARGDVVLDPALHAPTDRIDADLHLLAGESRPVKQWFPVRLHHAATEVGAHIVLLSDAPVAPGGTRRVQLVLEQPIAAATGDRFVVRDASGQRTIGGGAFLDLRAPARKRRTPPRLAQLDAYAIVDARQAFATLLTRVPYADVVAFGRDRALGATEIDVIARDLGVVRIAAGNIDYGFAPAVWKDLANQARSVVEEFHAGNPDLMGIGVEQLRRRLEPRLPAQPFVAVLHRLTHDGEVVLDGTSVRLRSHHMQLQPRDHQLWSKVKPLLSGAERFRPPRVREIADTLRTPEAEVRRLLKWLGRADLVREVAPDHFFLRQTVAEMVDIAADIAATSAGGQFTAAQFRDRLDNGRKVAIQILEFFDRNGVTARRGDLRRINAARRDLFSQPVASSAAG